MSRLAALLASLLTALVLAAGAGATSAPPRFGIQPLFRALPIVFLPSGARERASCSAHARQGGGRVRNFEKKLAPVACEQPPRSKLRDTDSSIVLAP